MINHQIHNSVACYDGEALSIWGTDHGMNAIKCKVIYEDKSRNVWFGTDGGVVHYDGHVFQTLGSPHIYGEIHRPGPELYFSTAQVHFTVRSDPRDERMDELGEQLRQSRRRWKPSAG